MKKLTSWGRELNLGAAVVIWVIVWSCPLLLVSSHIFWTCLNGKLFSLLSSWKESSAVRFFRFRRWQFSCRKVCFLGSRIDFGISRSNLIFAGTLFHIFWTCLNGKFVLLFYYCKQSSATRFLVFMICNF